MKKKFFIFFTLLSLSGSAQEASTVPQPQATDSLTTVTRTISVPKTEWLSPFNRVVVDGPVNITFKQVATDEELKIVYDTKGNITSRFRVGVDKNGVLQIVERADSKLTVLPTEVTVWYKKLDNISITHASANFEDIIRSKLLDMAVKGGANVTINIDSMDAFVECTGKSRLKIGGQSRYFKLNISTAKMEGLALNTVASNIDASHNAEVKLSVSERLEVVTSTAAKMYYKGRPTIIRNKNTLFGGEILAVE